MIDFGYWIDLALIIGLLAALISGRVSLAAAFMVFIGAVLVLGRLDVSVVLPKLGEPALVGIVCLVLFSSAMGRLGWLQRLMMSKTAHQPRQILLRFLASAGALSAFAPNTAVVGAFIGPAVKQTQVSPSLLLLPLSYIALAGGMVTQIGTSTSIVMVAEARKAGIELDVFSFFWPGLAVLFAVLVSLVVFAPLLLKNQRQSRDETSEGFHVQAEIPLGSVLAGRGVGENGLRNLHGFYLAEIERGGRLIAPVTPEDIVEAGDTLIFVGDAALLDSLMAIDGLTIEVANHAHFHGRLHQVVIAPGSMLIGRTLKEVGFRARFDASVLAVRRGQEPLSGKLGELTLRAGDLLMLAVGQDFASRSNLRANFLMVENNDLGDWNLTPRNSLLISLAFIAFSVGVLSNLVPFAIGALLLLLTAISAGWIDPRDIRRLFPFNMAICLWGSLVLAALIVEVGLDTFVAQQILALAGDFGPWVLLLVLFAATWALTEMLSNISAALTMLPVAIEIANVSGSPPEPFVLACTFAASASFIMPFGYQTHLMVMAPGHYQLKDFIKLGSLVLFAYMAASVSALTLIWF